MSCDAYVSEVVVVGRALSAEERFAVAEYFEQLWRAHWVENDPSRPHCCLRCRNRRRIEIRQAFARNVVERNELARRP